MSRIIFQESYIVIIPSFSKTEFHKHPFMHLFFSRKGCKVKVDKKEIQGNIIFLDSNVKHAVEEGSDCEFFLLIDSTSALAERILEKYVSDRFYCDTTGSITDVYKDIKCLSDEEIIKVVEDKLLNLDVSVNDIRTKDERIEQIISRIISGEWLNYNVKEIAKSVFLSESRLTHLFKDEVGISLKSYILIRRMEHAYRFVSLGGKIIQAAMESGFASSAHLAYTCKTLTGVSISDVLKSSKKDE